MTSGKREVHVVDLKCWECGALAGKVYSMRKINTPVLGACPKHPLIVLWLVEQKFLQMQETDELIRAENAYYGDEAGRRKDEDDYNRHVENAIEEEGIKREIQENTAMAGYDQMEEEQMAEAIMETQEPDEGFCEDPQDRVIEWEENRREMANPPYPDGPEDEVETQGVEAMQDKDPYDYDPEAEEARREDEASAIASEEVEREDY